MTKLPILTGLAVAATVAMSLSASAAPMAQITSVTGVWGPVVPGTTTGLSGVGTNVITWGTPTGSGQSGYSFVGVAPPTQGPFAADTDFDLGTFIHFNNPISAGTSITGAKLTVTIAATFSDDNFVTNDYRIVDSVFDFAHNETPNGVNPCADGGTNGVGINDNGCADSVTPTLNLAQSDIFTFMGVDYVFNVSNLGTGPVFWTREGADNSASMTGNFTAATNVIPLPAPFLLLLGGLAGLGVISRKRKAA